MEINDRMRNGQIFSYRMGPDLKTTPAVTVFFDASGIVPLINKNLSITDIRILFCLASICESETNITSFKAQDIKSIQYELSKYGVDYKEDTIKQSKKNMIKNYILGSVKRNYVMINPAIMYYAGVKAAAQYRYGNRRSQSKRPLEKIRADRMMQFRQLTDKNNPIGRKLVAQVLYSIYETNQESKHLSTYSSR